MGTTPIVAICMGSDSDLPVMKDAAQVLDEFGVPYEVRVLSAHRTPEAMTQFAEQAHEKGFRVIIAGAGGAAHLPGMMAASTPLPVLGVPVPSRHLQGLDSLLSVAQMPGGVPVGTLAIGGAKNAGLLAVRMLASSDPVLLEKMQAYRAAMRERVSGVDERVRAEYAGDDS